MTDARATYFGIDHSTLEFSPTDYVVRSVEAMIVPAIVALVVVLGALGVHALVSFLNRTKGRTAALRIGAIIVGVAGVVFAAMGFWAAFNPLSPRFYMFPPLALGGGTAACAYSVSVLRNLNSSRRDERIVVTRSERRIRFAVVTLVVVSAFWAASLYADALGRGRAQELASDLQSRPAVTVFSKQSLSLSAPVTETRIGNPESDYRFSYSGLRLLIRTANKFFLLTEGWSPKTGVAIILEDAPDIRLEFRPGGIR
ncbi:hypothetical protein [Rhodococcus koreensis]